MFFSTVLNLFFIPVLYVIVKGVLVSLSSKDASPTDNATDSTSDSTSARCIGMLRFEQQPLLSRSGYWSTLRPDGPSFRVFAKQMTNPPAACGSSTKSVIAKSGTTKSAQDDANRGETPK
jgi:hypothetical protein